MRRRWRSTAASPGFEPKSGEKISSAGGSIEAIIPLPISLRTKRALLFSLTSRLVSRLRPFSVCALAPSALMEEVRCDRFVHFFAMPRPGSDAGWARSSPSPPPACRPPALRARPSNPPTPRLLPSVPDRASRRAGRHVRCRTPAVGGSSARCRAARPN